MGVRTSLGWIMFLFLISLICLVYVLSNVDPYQTTILSFILFYLSFFGALAGLFSLTGFFLRKLFSKNKIPARLLRTSFKQGILISIILTGILLLWTLINKSIL